MSRVGLQRYAVIIVLDGCRPDYFDLVPMPNLRRLMKRGTTYSQASVGQLIANTPPGHATIGTGVHPKHHGIQGFWWKDPRTNRMTRPTDLSPVEHGLLERVLIEHHAPSIASAVKHADPHARIVSLSGNKCYAADAMGTNAADYILCSEIYHNRWVAQAMGRHQPPAGAINNPRFDVPIPPPLSSLGAEVENWNLGAETDWIIRYALWAFQRIRYPRVMMINLPETDVAMHFAGNDMTVAATLMRHVDRQLGKLVAAYQAARLLDRTMFVVTADHGMSVIQSRIPFGIFDRAIALAGATKVFLEADTAAALGIRETWKARQVAENVARLGTDAIDAVYYKTAERGNWLYRSAYARGGLPFELRQAFLHLANTTASDSGPDVLAIYAPHITTGDRIVRGRHWLAGHLGPQWDEQHIPLVLAGPGIQRDHASSYPAHLVDIAPTVEHAMGISPQHSDGQVLADALVVSTSVQRARQTAQQALRLPFIHALKARSGAR